MINRRLVFAVVLSVLAVFTMVYALLHYGLLHYTEELNVEGFKPVGGGVYCVDLVDRGGENRR